MKLLKADTDTAHFVCNIDTTLSVLGYFFRITGTNPVTELTKDDVGRPRYRYRNTTLVDASFAFLHHMGNITFGNMPFTSVGSGAMEMGIFIPRFWRDDNVEFVEKMDNAVFEIVFGSAVADQTGFLAELYAIEAEGINSYHLKYIQHGESYGGAGTFPETYSQENLLQAYISAFVTPDTTLVGSNITRLSFSLGNQKGDASIGAHLNWTNIVRRLETAFVLAVDMVSAEGDITARLHDKLDIQFEVSGASYPQILVLSALFNPDKFALTSEMFKNRLYSQLQQAKLQDKIRTIEVIKSIVSPSVMAKRISPSGVAYYGTKIGVGG